MGKVEKGVSGHSRRDSHQHKTSKGGNGNESNRGSAGSQGKEGQSQNGNGRHLANGNGATARRGSGLFLFARTFLKYPNMIGWMLPSSSWVVDRVLNEVHW